MDSRERTFLALQHQTPDRIPIDFWASRGMIRKLEARLGLTYDEFLDAHDVDFRYLAGPEYIGPPLQTARGGVSVDIWGVPRTIAEVALADGSPVGGVVATKTHCTATWSRASGCMRPLSSGNPGWSQRVEGGSKDASR